MNEINALNRPDSIDALLATKPSALDSVLRSAMAYEQPHYELVDQAQSELAELRNHIAVHDYDISQHISGEVGGMFDSEGLFVETTPSTVLVDRMVKEIKELRRQVEQLQAERDALRKGLEIISNGVNLVAKAHAMGIEDCTKEDTPASVMWRIANKTLEQS